MPVNSNRTPFTDICILIDTKAQKDKDGYEKDRRESRSEVLCSVSAGTARAEFYEAYKAGVRVSVTVELWEDDYGGQRWMEHGGKRYQVLRAYPTGHGTLELTCAEVVR